MNISIITTVLLVMFTFVFGVVLTVIFTVGFFISMFSLCDFLLQKIPLFKKFIGKD